MKNIYLILLSFLIISCSENAPEEPYLWFEENEIETDYHSSFHSIPIYANVEYSIHSVGDYFSNCEIKDQNDTLYISIPENKYSFDIYHEFRLDDYSYFLLADTLLILQKGNPNVDSGGNSGGSGTSGGGSSVNEGTSSRRCAAITKKGTRCKRMASKRSIYCWQHKKLR